MNIAYRPRIGLAAAVVAAAALLASPAAQSPRRMSMVNVINVPRVNDAQLSPDGNIAVYVLNVADWKVDRKVSHIWRQDIDGPKGGGPSDGIRVFRPGKQLTFGDAPDAFPRWSPDGKSILFFRGGQLFLESVEGGDPRPLTHHPTPIYVNPLAIGSIPAWSPDGAFVYFLASDPRTAEEREKDKQADEGYAFEENVKQRHLWKIAVSTGAERKLTDGDSSILSFRVSRDGRRIAFHRAPTPILNDSYSGEVWLMDADGANQSALTHNSVAEDEAELSPDNQHVLFLASTNQQFEPYYQTKIFVVPATGGTPKMLAPAFAHDIDHASWAPDGKSIYAVVNMGVHSELFQFDPGGGARPKQLTDGEHSIQFWSISGSAGKMVFGIDEPTRLADVWTMPLAGGAPTRATAVYDTLAQDFALPHQQRVVWKSTDGSTIEGLLYQAIGYERGKRYPLVVQLHTGPEDSDKFGAGSTFVNDYVALLAAKGFAVLKPNYHGSTGYGDAFKRDVVGGYFKHMADDVLTGVDYLIDQRVADPDRLIVMGWSAGGTLTNKLITMTDRFKAASSGAGVADWISMFSETDSRTFRIPWFGGTPWEKDAPIAAYWDHSPLKDVAKVRTPTIFLVGENDARVPKDQSIEMYRALKSNGVPTKLYMAPREGHAWGGLRHELFKANVELEWFERHAMGRAYVWEKPPSLP